MEKLKEILLEQLNKNLIRIIISGKKNKDVISDKIKVRPVEIKGNLEFQVTEYVGKKVLHNNLSKEEAVAFVTLSMSNNFKQGQIETVDKDFSVLVSKKGKVTIQKKNKKVVLGVCPSSKHMCECACVCMCITRYISQGLSC